MKAKGMDRKAQQCNRRQCSRTTFEAATANLIKMGVWDALA